jgi:signal transduction histidine kinase
LRNLKLRTKLLTIALPPLAILALLVAYAMKIAFLSDEVVSAAEIQADLQTFGLAGLAGLLGSALVLILVTRSVVTPLDRLTKAADELSSTRLPALVELLRNPGAAPVEPLDRLEAEADDEVGRLIAAFDNIYAAAADVTDAQRGLVRESLSSLVVNLARRNQALLDRQLQFIDELETREQDPDRLEELYRLDHLATRMRRNAESLLVLAGADHTRRRGAPVELLDVIRVALGEIEDYRHVELTGIQPGQVAAGVAVDLSHLLSELMENATHFSPPDTPVAVEGGRRGDGSYIVAITDHGIGMNDQQLADANTVLQHPPELGLELSRSLGFLVMGRLAQRLGVTVSLAATPGGGVTATVTVPGQLLVADTGSLAPMPPPEHRSAAAIARAAPEVPDIALGHPAGTAPPAIAPPVVEPGPAVPPGGVDPAPTPAAYPIVAHPSAAGPSLEPGGSTGPPALGPSPTSDGAGPPRRLDEALPQGSAFEQGLAALLEPTTSDDHTDSGLVRRRRGEHAPTERSSRPVAASGRTPQEIREMLARYRAGIKNRRPEADTGIGPQEDDS